MKKYAFIKIRTNHTVVRQIINILQYSFPEYEGDIIDIKPLLKKNPSIIFINILHIIRIYGFSSFTSGKNTLYLRFFGTPYIFHQIKRLINSEIASKNYVFTFQDNSLFDGSIHGTPNIVYTDHTLLENRYYPDFDESKDLLCDEWISLEKNIYDNATMVLTRYAKIVKSIVNDYSCDRSKVKCIYYAPYNESNPGTQNDNKYSTQNILFVGIDWERKGGPILLRAFRRIVSEYPEAKLTIVGCTPDINSPNVDVVGKISKEQLTEHYENASIFCLPTVKEHAGIVFTEAMRYRLPVIGTKIGAIPEYVDEGENGYLVDANSIDQLTDALVKLLEDREKRMAFGKNSYKKYCETFTLDVVSRKIREYLIPHIDMNPQTPNSPSRNGQ